MNIFQWPSKVFQDLAEDGGAELCDLLARPVDLRFALANSLLEVAVYEECSMLPSTDLRANELLHKHCCLLLVLKEDLVGLSGSFDPLLSEFFMAAPVFDHLEDEAEDFV